jgi:uncharacterized protein YjbJ (UPF0337 family)
MRTAMDKDEQKGRIETTLGNVRAGYGDLKDDLKKGS